MEDSLKRKRRLERNRESARGCRARKKERILALRKEIAKCEEANLNLRLQVASRLSNQADAESVGHKLEAMIDAEASEAELRQVLQTLQEKHADYGRDRQSAFAFHLKQLRRSLLPTQTTRALLFLMEQASTFIDKDGNIKEDALRAEGGGGGAKK